MTLNRTDSIFKFIFNINFNDSFNNSIKINKTEEYFCNMQGNILKKKDYKQ